MKLLTHLFGNRLNNQTAKRSTLQLEALEARDVPSARPLPVLMVIANQDYYHTSSITIAAPTGQDNTYYGTGIYKSTDSGRTWTLNQETVNQLAGALKQSFAPIGGNETISIGINQAQAHDDLGQWRQRFGYGG